MNSEAAKIMQIYEQHALKSDFYLTASPLIIDALFLDVTEAIVNAKELKLSLPDEFTAPSEKFQQGSEKAARYFEDRDNRRFFLSDVYDYLKLFHKLRP